MHSFFSRRPARRAFTLIELIVTIVILGILAALAVPAFSAVIDRSRDNAAARSWEALMREAQALAAFDQSEVTAAHIATALGDLAAGDSFGVDTGNWTYSADATLSAGEWRAYDTNGDPVSTASTVVAGLVAADASLAARGKVVALLSTPVGHAPGAAVVDHDGTDVDLDSDNAGLPDVLELPEVVEASEGAGGSTELPGGEGEGDTASTSAPAAVTNLTAQVSTDDVQLTWSASTGTDTYRVYRGSSALDALANPQLTATTALSYTDSNLDNGDYVYVVTAENAHGSSQSEVSATISVVVAPTDYGTPYANITSTEVTVTGSTGPAALTDENDNTYLWYQPANVGDNYGTDFGSIVTLTHLRVTTHSQGVKHQMDNLVLEYSADCQSFTPISGVNLNAAIDTDVSLGGPVNARCIQVRSTGADNWNLAIARFEPYYVDPIPPPVPTGLTADGSTDGQFTLSWDLHPDTDGDLAAINVYRDGSLVGTAGPTDTSFIASLAAGGSATFSLTATDQTGNESAASSTATASTTALPVTVLAAGTYGVGFTTVVGVEYTGAGSGGAQAMVDTDPNTYLWYYDGGAEVGETYGVDLQGLYYIDNVYIRSHSGNANNQMANAELQYSTDCVNYSAVPGVTAAQVSAVGTIDVSFPELAVQCVRMLATGPDSYNLAIGSFHVSHTNG